MPRQRRRAPAAHGVAVQYSLTDRPLFVLDLFVVQVVRHIVRSDTHARRMGALWIGFPASWGVLIYKQTVKFI